MLNKYKNNTVYSNLCLKYFKTLITILRFTIVFQGVLQMLNKEGQK